MKPTTESKCKITFSPVIFQTKGKTLTKIKESAHSQDRLCVMMLNQFHDQHFFCSLRYLASLVDTMSHNP